MLPKQYAYLQSAEMPKMIQEALKLYGTREIVGGRHNPVILDWARVVGIPELVKDDEQPWCGLFAAYVAVRAQKHVPMKGWDILRALQWQRFGTPVKEAGLGDILVFRRPGGGHVGIYVGEDQTTYHVLGGNQGNEANIIRIEKVRCVAIRRPHYQNQPPSVKPVWLNASGPVSRNEA